ncbi:MAG: hypothetical protein LBK44_02425 [Spirochaetales bacterium]|nr:hypothetical protein [Spirochaetales bacterium]
MRFLWAFRYNPWRSITRPRNCQRQFRARRPQPGAALCAAPVYIAYQEWG